MNLSDKENQGREMRLTAIIIILISVCGFVFLMLEQFNVTNILDNYNKIPLFILMIFFFIMGIMSLGSAKRTVAKAEIENSNVNEILTWFRENVNKDNIPAILVGSNDDNEIYMNRITYVNALIAQNFPHMRELPQNLDEIIVDEIFK